MGDYKLIARLGIETGLRVGDILNLKFSDIRNPLSVYESKSKRCRTIKLSYELFKALQAHAIEPGYIFHGKQSKTLFKPLNRSTVYKRISKAGDCSAHSLRKLYAQNIFRETEDIFTVQEALHHKYVTTTATYLDIDLSEILRGIKP